MAILCMYSIAILEITVNIISIVLEVIYVILYAFLFPMNILSTSFRNLPPIHWIYWNKIKRSY